LRGFFAGQRTGGTLRQVGPQIWRIGLMNFIDWKEKLDWSKNYSEQIIEKLFQPEKRRHKQICEEFLKRNNEIIGENRDGFRYKEKAFLAAYNTAPLAT